MNILSRNISRATIFLALVLSACSGVGNTSNSNDKEILSLVANGEDFVRQGFVTKDGWSINFDKVLVSVGNVKAYQTQPSFNPDTDSEIKAQTTIALVDEAQVIDLAAGEENAEPIQVLQTKAPVGFYNALSWETLPSSDRNITDQTILLQGTATKDSETVNFNLGFALPVSYSCGEFVGDTRKGILKPGAPAEIEMTFHFDHVFGDADTPADDYLNQHALGFQPLANIAQSGELNSNWDTLQQQLSVEDRETVTKAIIGLAHVGEGHCKATYKQ